MRLENDDDNGKVARIGFVFEFLQNVFVTEVYAVEITDGDGRSLRKIRCIVLTESDFHGRLVRVVEWSRIVNVIGVSINRAAR